MHSNYDHVLTPYIKLGKILSVIAIEFSRKKKREFFLLSYFSYQLVHEKFIKWYCWDSQVRENARKRKKKLGGMSIIFNMRNIADMYRTGSKVVFIIYGCEKVSNNKQSRRCKKDEHNKCCLKIDVTCADDKKYWEFFCVEHSYLGAIKSQEEIFWEKILT